MTKETHSYLKSVLTLVAIEFPQHPGRAAFYMKDDGRLILSFAIGDEPVLWAFNEEIPLTPLEVINQIKDQAKQAGLL